MSRLLALLPVLACLAAAPVHAGAPSPKQALRTRLASVEARRGVAHRSLALVALVARAPESAAPLAYATAGLTWAPRKGDEVTIGAEDAAEDRILPSGVELMAGNARRLLCAPLRVPAGEGAAAPTIRIVRGGTEPAPHTFLAVRGPEVRHLLAVAPDATALADLLDLERVLADLPDGELVTPGALANAPRITAVRDEAKKALRVIPSAYGGALCGHVAFLGNRPVEVVLAAHPDTYAAYVRAATDGYATYLALWEELYGRTGPLLDAKPDWPRLLAVAAARVRDLGTGRPLRTEDAGRWKLRPKRGESLGWMLTDAAQDATWIEAWPTGAPFPVPAREPGGPPEDEAAGNRESGSLTLPLLERLVERLRKIRDATRAAR